MRKVTSLFVLLILSLGVSAQILEPAEWKVSLSKAAPKPGDEVKIIFEVTIDDNWYLYSSDFDPDLGPMVTEFEFTEHPSYELVGDVQPIGAQKKYDSLWEGEYTYFKKKARFEQTVKILDKKYQIEGLYIYQVCSDIDGKCIPFEEEFSLVSKKKEVTAKPSTDTGLLSQRDASDPYSLWSFMLVAFLAGLAALLTPCVFPMIPMTVTYFTGKDHHKKGRFFNSFFYGISIIVIYSLIGVVLAPFMGPETANDLATGWLPNVIFFVVFVLFALSFFGLFEITLPHKWVNSVDAMGDKGGLVGIFFMALTLVLVSFSCTGPIVGSILVESAGGLALKPVLGMAAFSAAFAIPFTLFALFPNWLNSLPKSGGWLNSVKVVLGFVELALAFKFLSIADQAYHWQILDREIYLAIWIVIFGMMGFYLLGKIKLASDSESNKVSVPRLILAMITFTFVIYLIPGMFGAPLKALAGYLPPMSTHDFNLLSSTYGPHVAEDLDERCEQPLYDDFLEWPHGLQGYFDYEQALSCAQATNKPIFVDFTGHGCVNCREMEARVWSEPEVLSRLRQDFVLLALYVDDKTELPSEQWYTSDYDGKVKKTIGKQNADFQITSFQNNAQPFYVILSPEGELLVEPTAYDLNVGNFVSFLDSGKQAFKN
ncbi:protein-disulfide reductase DsbD family protein [Marinoscillum furvescens]|uniref:Thiol:disulfide interchange protein DsbD n=1 Tax=Marinoscillum furvescens DSM 4134 TaxID=1122208 RepID=A0A3D9L2H4_MARFU|nr:cytochrome c biogenesis protein CcdA [Marinoscillum furvescens]RED98939.1 thiol:disulfide interchange protein DsbD [Marinoscillum furvescens DSM 4134]